MLHDNLQCKKKTRNAQKIWFQKPCGQERNIKKQALDRLRAEQRSRVYYHETKISIDLSIFQLRILLSLGNFYSHSYDSRVQHKRNVLYLKSFPSRICFFCEVKMFMMHVAIVEPSPCMWAILQLQLLEWRSSVIVKSSRTGLVAVCGPMCNIFSTPHHILCDTSYMV